MSKGPNSWPMLAIAAIVAIAAVLAVKACNRAHLECDGQLAKGENISDECLEYAQKHHAAPEAKDSDSR